MSSIETLLKEIERTNTHADGHMFCKECTQLLAACRELVRGLESVEKQGCSSPGCEAILVAGVTCRQTLARAAAILGGERLEGEGK